MPKAFEDCVKRGGRVRSVPIAGDRYMHVCWLNGKAFQGEIKSRKKKRK